MSDSDDLRAKTAHLAAAITTLLNAHTRETGEGVSRIVHEQICLDALALIAANLLADPPDDRSERREDFFGRLYRAIEKEAAAAGATDVIDPCTIGSQADRDAIQRQMERYDFVMKDAKRHFGQWDSCDPVVWALLRVVQAQNDFAHAIDQDVNYGAPKQMVEDAISERIKAINALVKAITEEPRGFQ